MIESHERLSFVSFKSLRMAIIRFHRHAYQPHLPMPCAVSTAHAQSQIGKGRRVIESISMHTTWTAAYPGHEAKYTTLLLQQQCGHAWHAGYVRYRALVLKVMYAICISVKHPCGQE